MFSIYELPGGRSGRWWHDAWWDGCQATDHFPDEKSGYFKPGVGMFSCRLCGNKTRCFSQDVKGNFPFVFVAMKPVIWSQNVILNPYQVLFVAKHSQTRKLKIERLNISNVKFRHVWVLQKRTASTFIVAIKLVLKATIRFTLPMDLIRQCSLCNFMLLWCAAFFIKIRPHFVFYDRL